MDELLRALIQKTHAECCRVAQKPPASAVHSAVVLHDALAGRIPAAAKESETAFEAWVIAGGDCGLTVANVAAYCLANDLPVLDDSPPVSRRKRGRKSVTAQPKLTIPPPKRPTASAPAYSFLTVGGRRHRLYPSGEIVCHLEDQDEEPNGTRNAPPTLPAGNPPLDRGLSPLQEYPGR